MGTWAWEPFAKPDQLDKDGAGTIFYGPGSIDAIVYEYDQNQ